MKEEALKKAKELALGLKEEKQTYLRLVLKYLRKELKLPAYQPSKPYIPTDEEIQKYYDYVWKAKKIEHVVLIKTFLYTGVKLTELVFIKLKDIDFERCQIKIGGNNARTVPFPKSFKELLALYVQTMEKQKSIYLFESSHKQHFTDRGVRKIIEKYTQKAGIKEKIVPKTLRHFLFKWMQKHGVEEAFTQTYSGHKAPESLSVYKSLTEGQNAYDKVIDKFPI